MAATTQVQILVWTQGYGSSCRHAHVRCVRVRGNYIFHDLPASSGDIAARRVAVIVDNMEKRRSPDDLGLLVPLRFSGLVFIQGPHRLVVGASHCGQHERAPAAR